MSYNLFYQESSTGEEAVHCLTIHPDREPGVEILKDNLNSFYAFEEVINNIYLGYRQCYSKEPKVVKPLSSETKNRLLTKFDEYFKVLMDDKSFEEFKAKFIAEKGIEHFCDFLYKCSFIKAHLNHESPFEHGVITYRITHASRACLNQLVRCRIASYSQMSQRYCAEDPKSIDVVLPKAILENKDVFQDVTHYLYQLPELIEKMKKAGIKNEDIRAVFPNAMCSDIVVTMNLREIKHFLELRTNSHAQTEIRYIANELRTKLIKYMPFIWSDIGDKVV